MQKKINDYIGMEDCIEKAGYWTFKPLFGTLGQALLKASKNQGRSSFINKCLDSYFKKLRQQRKRQNKNDNSKKQDSRYHLQPDAANNSKECC